MKSILSFIVLLVFLFPLSAQNQGSIAGKIQHAEENYFLLVLKKSQDSSIVKTEYTGNGNAFLFEQIPFGSYFLEISAFNFKDTQTPIFNLDKNMLSLEPIKVEENINSLKEVTIVAQKSIVERKMDKVIYNVENTLEAPTNDALAVMQKAPGITVDQDGNISMRGKRGVMVMINGKMTYLTGGQLSNLLRTTTANQIAKIEVISNPSSKYDAEGNAGIVNIVLKKDSKQGTNGMIVLSYGHGQYHKAAEGININIKGKKVSLFASYNYSNNKGFNDLRLYRRFYKNQVLQGAYNQNNYLLFPSNNNIGKIGIDYNISPSFVVGAVANLSLTQFNPKGNNISYVENGQSINESYYTSDHYSKENWNNYSINLNAKKTLDSLGQEITADVDYAQYTNKADQNFNTHFYTLDNLEYKNAYLLRGDVLGNLSIKAFKLDYVKPFKKDIKLETGAKSSFVIADNNLAYYNQSAGTSIFDSTQSNHFIYSENINALYVSLAKERKNTSIQVGLRAEQTIAKGRQLLNDSAFNRNYWQLFPTFFLTQKINQNHDLGLSFSRRIQRPGYDLMNPIRLFIDATTYKVGNPYLVPQNSYMMELSHTFRQKYLTTLSATFINKSITEVLIPDEKQNNITLQTNKNINQQFLYSLNFSVPIKITDWWSMNNDATVYYSHYQGKLANMDINSGTASFNCKSIQTITLPKAIALQIDAFYQHTENFSFSTTRPFGAVNVALQKSFLQKKATLKLAFNDIFYNSRFSGSAIYTDYYEQYRVRRDSRTVVLSLSYRYGKTSVPSLRRRATGAEDEKQRAAKG